MKNSVFLVNEEPYCLWEDNIEAKNKFFLNSIDPEYYNFLYEAFKDNPQKQLASVTVRTALFQAAETFYALLGAFIQAPNCVYAWISKYKNNELRHIIQKLNNNEDIFTILNIKTASWKDISEAIFSPYSTKNEDNNKIAYLFANFWKRLSIELFLDEKFIDEYNSLKHGLRVRHGGFSLSIARQTAQDQRIEDSEFVPLGGSKYGTTFFKIKDLKHILEEKGDKGIYSEKVSLNWSHEQNMQFLLLLHMSIYNIVSALKIMNNLSINEPKYKIPEQLDLLDNVFNIRIGVKHFTLPTQLKFEQIKHFKKSDLIKIIDIHKKRLHQKCTK